MNFARSLSWSPTVGLSWLWGLGFFYAFHVTLANGWLGFLCFAAPNALGLFLFGWVLGSPKRNPDRIVTDILGRYSGLLIFCQLFAVAITFLGFQAYLWRPLFGTDTLIPLGLLAFAGCIVGHAATLNALRRVHLVYLIVGVAAAVMAGLGLQAAWASPGVALGAFDSRFTGLLLPIAVGFLLGPWTDLQHWARVVEIRRRGGSIRVAYGFGAALFFLLLGLNAWLASLAGPEGWTTFRDGVSGGQMAVATAFAHHAPGLPALAFLIWGAVAVLSTIDSSYNAFRWHFSAIAARSASPLLAFIPEGVAASPMWIMGAAALVAAAMFEANISMIYLMAPFATLLAGAAANLVLETLGFRGRYDPTLAFMVGLAASLVLLEGYTTGQPALETIAPLIALIGALPMLTSPDKPAAAKPHAGGADETPGRTAPGANLALVSKAAAPTHGFDHEWFVYHVTPTYDDTNSVGNIYFANYIRWVGKARELFFNECMPDFDLKTTNFYVLTRSFNHEFRHEAREFEQIVVRVKIASHNRKFVTLAHELFAEEYGILGSGEQSLMFADAKDFHLLDIPRAIVQGFAPYWPKSSPHAMTDDAAGNAA